MCNKSARAMFTEERGLNQKGLSMNADNAQELLRERGLISEGAQDLFRNAHELFAHGG